MRVRLCACACASVCVLVRVRGVQVLWSEYMATNSANALADLKRRLRVHDHPDSAHPHLTSHPQNSPLAGRRHCSRPFLRSSRSPAGGLGSPAGEGGTHGGEFADFGGGGDASTWASSVDDDASLASAYSLASTEYSLAPFAARAAAPGVAAALGPLPGVLAAAQRDRALRVLSGDAQRDRADAAGAVPRPAGGAVGAAPALASARVASAALAGHAASGEAAAAVVGAPLPLPAGVLAAGRVPWGSARCFEVLVDDPNEILTITLVATTPTLHDAQTANAAVAAAAAAAAAAAEANVVVVAGPRSESSRRASSLPSPGPLEAPNTAPHKRLEASPFGLNAISAVPGGDFESTPRGSKGDEGGGARAVWTAEEVARRRPAGLAKADLFVRKVRHSWWARKGREGVGAWFFLVCSSLLCFVPLPTGNPRFLSRCAPKRRRTRGGALGQGFGTRRQPTTTGRAASRVPRTASSCTLKAQAAFLGASAGERGQT